MNKYSKNPLLKLIGDNDVVDYSKIFIENSKIFVKSSPLYGMEGYVYKVDKRRGRAKVIFDFMGSKNYLSWYGNFKIIK